MGIVINGYNSYSSSLLCIKDLDILGTELSLNDYLVATAVVLAVARRVNERL